MFAKGTNQSNLLISLNKYFELYYIRCEEHFVYFKKIKQVPIKDNICFIFNDRFIHINNSMQILRTLF